MYLHTTEWGLAEIQKFLRKFFYSQKQRPIGSFWHVTIKYECNERSLTMFAHAAFKDLLEETLELQGWTMPKTVVNYTTSVLAEFVDRPHWQPEPSYAEQYMTIRTAAEAQRLGDVCWFTRAVFPELGERRGISASYYVQLGEGCYDRVLRTVPDPAVKLMRDHFEFIAEMALTAIRAQGGFRTMWD